MCMYIIFPAMFSFYPGPALTQSCGGEDNDASLLQWPLLRWPDPSLFLLEHFSFCTISLLIGYCITTILSDMQFEIQKFQSTLWNTYNYKQYMQWQAFDVTQLQECCIAFIFQLENFVNWISGLFKFLINANSSNLGV